MVTQKEIEWLRLNYPSLTNDILIDIFNKKFKTNKSKDYLRKLAWKNDIKKNVEIRAQQCIINGSKSKGYKKYTYEMETFIKENYPITETQDFCVAFNEKFGTDFKPITLKHKANDLGIKKDKNIIIKINSKSLEKANKKCSDIYLEKYGVNVINYIKENYQNVKNKDLIEQIKNKFNVVVTNGTIKNISEKFSIKKNPDFLKNIRKESSIKAISINTKYSEDFLNKFKELYEFSSNEDISEWALQEYNYKISKRNIYALARYYGFKKNEKFTNYLQKMHSASAKKANELGYEYYDRNKDMYIVKTKDGWQRKNRYLYEKYYNVKLKSNELVICLDGNNENLNIENLFVINNKEFGVINNLDIANMSKEERMLVFDYAKLKTLLKEKRGN